MEKDLESAFQRDSGVLITHQLTSGFSRISDGQLKWQDHLRPIAESLTGLRIEAGLSRWFDTNTFYKKPVVTGELEISDFSNLFAKNYYFSVREASESGELKRVEIKERSISLLGPYTMASLVEDNFYGSKPELTKRFADILATAVKGLAERGITSVEFAEPSLVYQSHDSKPVSRDEIDATVSSYASRLSGLPVKLGLHTYFGDSSKLLPDLLGIPTVSTIGIDFTQTSIADIKLVSFNGKALGIGCVDARNSLVESPEWVANFSFDAVQALKPSGVVITPNTGLKYLPRIYADEKVRSIAYGADLLRKKLENSD